MKATLTFDLNNEDDVYRYNTYKQAEQMHTFISEFKDGLRTISKYDAFPAGVYPGMISDNLTALEKDLQSTLYEAEVAKVEPDKRGNVSTQFRLYDELGRCTISGITMIDILRDYFFELVKQNNLDLD